MKEGVYDLHKEQREEQPLPKFKIGDEVVEVREWYEDPVQAVNRAFKTPEGSPLKLEEIKKRIHSSIPYQVRVWGLEIWIVTFENQQDISTLRVWELEPEKLVVERRIDLDVLMPTETGREAHELIINGFELSDSSFEYRFHESRRFTITGEAEWNPIFKNWIYSAELILDDGKTIKTTVSEDKIMPVGR